MSGDRSNLLLAAPLLARSPRHRNPSWFAHSCFFPYIPVSRSKEGQNRSSRTDMHSGNLLALRKHSARVTDSRHPGLFRFS